MVVWVPVSAGSCCSFSLWFSLLCCGWHWDAHDSQRALQDRENEKLWTLELWWLLDCTQEGTGFVEWSKVPFAHQLLGMEQTDVYVANCLVKLWNWLVQIAVHAKLDWCYFRGFSNVIWKSVPVRQPGIQNWKKSNKDTFCSSSHLTLKIV